MFNAGGMKIPFVFFIVFAGAHAFAERLGLFPSANEYTFENFAKLGLVEFESSRPDAHAPIAIQMALNGKRVTNQFVLFNERLLARLPDQSPILVQSEDTWDFPVGAMVVHELRFNDRARTLFEMRVVEKLDDRHWGYGAYVPEGDRLVLRRHQDSEKKNFLLEDEEGKAMAISLATVAQRVCAQCHSTAGLGRMPVGSSEEAGPCEFQPKNGTLRSTWAAKFFKERGWNPFERKP